jgi:hypothetical protein
LNSRLAVAVVVGVVELELEVEVGRSLVALKRQDLLRGMIAEIVGAAGWELLVKWL